MTHQCGAGSPEHPLSTDAHTRLRLLGERGYIPGDTALVSRERLGDDMLCCGQIGMQAHTHTDIQHDQSSLEPLPEALARCHTTGEVDSILKVVLRDRSDLERVLADPLTQAPHIARAPTSVVIRDVKSATGLPLIE